MRPRVPLVAGEEPTPLERVLIAADSATGCRRARLAALPLYQHRPDAHLLREPEGDWVCLDAVTHDRGLGLSDTALYERGCEWPRGADTARQAALDSLHFPRRFWPKKGNLSVAYFKDPDEVYAYIGRLFERLAEDDELAPKFRKANTIVQYQYRDPESQITVKLIEGEDGQVDCGETTMEPEVVMTMDADTAHRFWLGKVNVTVARARADEGQGPRGEDPQAGAAGEAGVSSLPQILEEDGREDLLGAS